MPAPAPAHTSTAAAGSTLPSWAHAAQYFSSAAQVRKDVPTSGSLPARLPAAASPCPRMYTLLGGISWCPAPPISRRPANCRKGLQHLLNASQGLQAAGSKPWQHMRGEADPMDYPAAQAEPLGRSASSVQRDAFSGAGFGDSPAKASQMSSSKAPPLPQQDTQGAQTPVPKTAGKLSKWAPFHAIPKLSAAAHPSEQDEATYLLPSEVKAIGG